MTRGRDGKIVERLPIFPAPCRTDKGCPKGNPESPRSLMSENERCYEHYRECRAVNQFPDDPVVRRNAAAIRDVEDLAEHRRQEDLQSELLRHAMGMK